ncbi:MAG: 4-hydroxybenzoate octaprenyltransferase [Alphaproteobacteria bacterium]|nr:4-hydroxybenzoate octaprenyltransferase [Alphaproteobacteria bacterium]
MTDGSRTDKSLANKTVADRIPDSPSDIVADPSDIVADHWAARILPRAAQPYLELARIDRPIGTWLLLLPGWWALAMSAPAGATTGMVLYYFALFGVGAVVMRGAGCVVNDLADREFDATVARTASRPLPSGAVSVRQALIFLGLLLIAGLVILLQFNRFAVLVGAASLVLVVTYPFMKRITYWPQAVLGLTFNWGALLGWAAMRGTIDGATIALYGAGFFWTLGYDTIYAHQDRQDDALVGIKSTALLLGEASAKWIAVFYAAAILLLGAAGWLTFGVVGAWPFWLGLAFCAAHLTGQLVRTDFSDSANCLATFKANRNFGLIFLIGIAATRILA